MTAPRLSVVVITRNEAERLPRCLASVAWADEIVVVDSGSDDKTVEVARGFTEHVSVHAWEGYARQKNHAIGLARGEWILSLDADEAVSPELAAEIRSLLPGASADGFAISRRNIYWGRWVRHGLLYPDWQVRLFRRGRGRFVEREVHEAVEVEGRVDRLAGALVHTSYRDVADFVTRTNRYTTLAADDWVGRGRGLRATDLVLRPLGRFVSMYVVHRGFLDGWRGFLLAVLYAYYVFVRSAKVWERVRR